MSGFEVGICRGALIFQGQYGCPIVESDVPLNWIDVASPGAADVVAKIKFPDFYVKFAVTSFWWIIFCGEYLRVTGILHGEWLSEEIFSFSR